MAETDKIEALEAKVVDEANSPNPQADAPKKNAVAAEPSHIAKMSEYEDLGKAVVKPTDSNPDATKKMKKVSGQAPQKHQGAPDGMPTLKKEENDKEAEKKSEKEVKEGEIFGIAGVAGNGQSELMDILIGENCSIDSGEIIFKKNNIESFNPQQRRDLSIAFVPENRLGHSAVPELTLSENILLSQFPNNNFSNLGILNKNFIENYANEVINNFNVVTPGSDVKASSLSGGNLQKFVIGREISSNPKLLIISHPTWGIDAGAEYSIRQSLINLAKNGTSIIVLSQDIDELIEITHRMAVIYNGSLSESFITKEIDITKLGLLMGGKND